MGQLLSNLNIRNGTDAMVPDVAFDIENATPGDEELYLYNQISSMLVQPAPELLHQLSNYQSASEFIRTAIASPTQENENRAWEAVLPIVDKLRDFYEYAAELDPPFEILKADHRFVSFTEDCLPQLLSMLCSGDVNKNLEKYRGLTKLFAEILDFVFEFDYLKMRNASLQNDFSYYRRMLQRGRYTNSTVDANGQQSDMRNAMIEDEQANRISLFIAYPTPMLKCVIDTTANYVVKHNVQKSVCDCLTAVWASCFLAVSKKRSQRPEAAAFCLKVMVVSIILYDHIDPHGAFSKQSPINIKNSVKLIQAINVFNIPQNSSASNLMPALRYNSKHLNDDSTPKGVKNLVMAT